MKSKLLLSASSIATFQTCRRRYYYEKILGLRPKETADSLAFGSAVHRGLERIFRAMMEAGHRGEQYSHEFRLTTVEDAYLSALEVDLSESDRIKVEVLLAKYAEIYLESDMRDLVVVDVERKGVRPILSPKSERKMRGTAVLGYCDALAKYKHIPCVIEHKTTSAMTDDFFAHASIDLQVYLYADIYSHIGYGDSIKLVIYDAIQKPRHEMSVGESDEEFEARKAASKCPARCKRKESETAEEFRIRLEMSIDESYFRREFIEIDDSMLLEMHQELWEVAHDISKCTCFGKSTCNCMKWGKCPYMDVCKNHGSFFGLDDKFTKWEPRNESEQTA